MENRGYPVSSMRLCIDESDHKSGILTGKIYGVAMEHSISFRSSEELILAIDKGLNQIGRPQATSKIRSFQEKENKSHTPSFRGNPVRYHSDEEIREKRGILLTEDLFFLSRHHSTWQGFIIDEQGHPDGEFESDLEMLMHILKHAYKTKNT